MGKGIRPAFWLLGANSQTVAWPQCGEEDIMEFLGAIYYCISEWFTLDTRVPMQLPKTIHYQTIDLIMIFHIFGIEWGENYINYYVDDVLYNQITPQYVTGEWVFNQPFYIILNMAVGGKLPRFSKIASPFFHNKCL